MYQHLQKICREKVCRIYVFLENLGEIYFAHLKNCLFLLLRTQLLHNIKSEALWKHQTRQRCELLKN